MKRMIYVWVLFLFSSSNKAVAQLELGLNKTVCIVFTAPVQFVDRGCKDILVQKARGAENILLVKAATEKMPESSLSVVTDDGKLYCYLVRFNANPGRLILYTGLDSTRNQDSAIQKILFIGNAPVKNELMADCHHVEGYSQFLHGIKNSCFGVSAAIHGFYIKDNIIFCQFLLSNSTNIDYEIENARFYLRDKRKGKRTAVQEEELIPVCHSRDLDQVKANETKKVVIALHQFTIPDDKNFYITLTEKNGGRHLRLRINNRKLTKARLF